MSEGNEDHKMDVAVPIPIGRVRQAHRTRSVTHRGRVIRYTCADESPVDRARLIEFLASLVREGNDSAS